MIGRKAAAIVNRKTKEAEGQDEADMMPEEEDDEDSELKDIVTAHFIDAGMFETRCTSTDFVVYLSNPETRKMAAFACKTSGPNGLPGTVPLRFAGHQNMSQL